ELVPGQRQDWQPQVLQQVQDLAERPWRVAELVGEQAGQVGAEVGVCEPERRQRHGEIGDAESEKAKATDQVVELRVLMGGGVDANWNGDDVADGDGDGGQKYRPAKAIPDQLSYRHFP